MKRNQHTRWATLAVCAAMAQASQAALTALSYKLGEDDPGATGGSALQATTDDSGAGDKDLTRQGSGGTYSTTVPLGGSTLSGLFDGSQSFSASGSGFYSGIDYGDFSFSCDARPTGNASGFSIAMTLGKGGSGQLFFYHTGQGSTWRLHSNGIGDLVSGSSVNLGQWYHLEAKRSGTQMSFYIDGNLIGTTGSFTNTGVLGDSLSIGSGLTGGGVFEGRFQGQVDNVSVIPETSAVMLGLAGFGLALRRRR
ncbi:MAG: LamG domain-containing protein [Verrucomicrobia bacterium]|nr:LamG domain-containing protein [Verrucomicrobiota bacterium]